MTKLIDKIEKIYLDEFYALPDCEMKTKALHALKTVTKISDLDRDTSYYLQDNLLSDEEHPFILDLLKTYDNRSSGSSLCNGEGGINIKSGWGL
jgi:hypothetical protein